MIQELSLSPEMLDKIAELAGVAKEQSIEIAHEYLAWWFIQSMLTASMFAVFGVLASWLCYKSWKKLANFEGEEWLILAMFTTIIAPILLVASAESAMHVVKISVAPRAYVIDKFLEKTK